MMHGVRGRVEHWSDGTIRIREFFYDGLGPRDVVVWLYNHDRNNFHAILDGFAVSEHLARSRPYLGENLALTLPGGRSLRHVQRRGDLVYRGPVDLREGHAPG